MKCLLKQLLTGVPHLHYNLIIHKDLKTYGQRILKEVLFETIGSIGSIGSILAGIELNRECGWSAKRNTIFVGIL